jgi:hypothetical protein
VLNGKILQATAGGVDLESRALDLQEVMVALEDGELPRITVGGQPVRVTIAGSPARATI